jgi:fatty acid desaturase
MVPYHALPKLHEEMKADTPKPYNGLIEAYREIIPAILRQVKDPAYFVKRELPSSAKPFPTSMPIAQPAH